MKRERFSGIGDGNDYRREVLTKKLIFLFAVEGILIAIFLIAF